MTINDQFSSITAVENEPNDQDTQNHAMNRPHQIASLLRHQPQPQEDHLVEALSVVVTVIATAVEEGHVYPIPQDIGATAGANVKSDVRSDVGASRYNTFGIRCILSVIAVAMVAFVVVDVVCGTGGCLSSRDSPESISSPINPTVPLNTFKAATPTVSPSVLDTPITNSTQSPTSAPNASDGDGNLRVSVKDIYLAYAAPSADREPTSNEYAQIVNLTALFYNAILTQLYEPNMFFIRVEPTLNITLYQAGVPDIQFNIYMQYSAMDLVFAPKSTPPSPEDTFVSLRGSIDSDYILSYARSLTDSPFVSTNEVIFRESTMENSNSDSLSLKENKG